MSKELRAVEPFTKKKAEKTPAHDGPSPILTVFQNPRRRKHGERRQLTDKGEVGRPTEYAVGQGIDSRIDAYRTVYGMKWFD